VCQSEAEARDRYGVLAASQLRVRLADLRAALTIEHLPAGNSRPFAVSENTEMAVRIGELYQLVFGPNHPRGRFKTSGDPDWSTIHRIKVLRIEEIP